MKTWQVFSLTHLTDVVIVAYVGSNDSVKQVDFLGRVGESVATVAAASVGDYKGRLYGTVDVHGDLGV